jgi:hypothetical protein
MAMTQEYSVHKPLTRLRHARQSRAWLEAKIKDLEAPHIEAAKAASAGLRAMLSDAKNLEARANDDSRTAYLALESERRAQLLAGHEVSEIQLPENWTVQHRSGVEIVEPEAIPRAYCVPDAKAVAAALKNGTTIPGARPKITPVFVFRSTPAAK